MYLHIRPIIIDEKLLKYASRLKRPRFITQQVLHPIRKRKPYAVNEEFSKVQTIYNRFLGNAYSDPLPIAIIWQVFTHKSFAHGSKPYNENLSFLGKRLIQMQILDEVLATFNEGICAIKPGLLEQLTNVKSLCNVAIEYNFDEVIRWKPRMVSSKKYLYLTYNKV